MKAAQITEYGTADNISVNDIDKPVLEDGKVLVSVKAASLNPFDLAMLGGYVSKDGKLSNALTLGGDIAGVVESAGPGVKDFKTGDKVYGTALNLSGGSGGLAQYATVGVRRLALMPKNLDFAQAASLPLAGSSAVQAIFEHMQLQPNQKLFIHGASGGIGTLSIQIAKNIGAYVAASTRGDKAEKLKSLGADKVIDTESLDFSTELKDLDAILNVVRDSDFDKFLVILKSGGTLVSLTGIPDNAAKNEHDIHVVSQMTNTNTEHLDKLRELVERGAVKPVVAATYPLAKVRDAFQKLEAGGYIGKIVVTIND